MDSSWKLFIVAFLLVGLTNSSLAAGTLAGTTISNQATANFNVSGVAQAPKDSNIHSFVVDKAINLSFVKNNLSHVAAIPNQTNVVSSFTLTNLGNSTQDFNIAVAQQTTGSTDAFGETDSTNLTSATIRVDGNSNGTYEAANDTRTFVDELTPDTAIVVFILGRFPATATNGQIAGLNVTARARAGGVVGTQGANLTQSAGADVIGTMDTRFLDGIGTGTGDANRDSRIAALTAYKVVTAVINTVASSAVISDPVNGLSNPKAMPGATIEYTINISNSGSANATNIVANDIVATTLTYVPGSIVVDGVSEDDNTTGVDETNPNGGRYTSATRQVRGIIATLNMGETKSIKFRATVN